jgi:MSHA biogenesis protein MshO
MSGRPTHRPRRGFTLVELTVVIVLTGVIAAALTVFLRPAVDTHLALRHRSDLLHAAESALDLTVREVRRALPNSIRTPDSQCVELLPTVGGGRYRQGPDTVNDRAAGCTPGGDCSAWVDTSTTSSVFDVLHTTGSGTGRAAVGDWVVIDSQNGADAYAGRNRRQVTAVATPAAAFGVQRLTIDPPLQVSPGYDGGRFYRLDPATQAVTYSCVGADGTLDTQGNGRGRLLRRSGYGFDAAYPTACPTTGAVVATGVRRCQFVYDPNQGATQQSGYLWVELELARAGESVHLSMGAHVSNAP